MRFRLSCGMLMLAVSAWSQQYAISTVAGGAVLPTPVMATAVPVNGIGGVAADSSGNVYFTSSNCVFKLDQSGMLTRVAGNGRAGFSGDGGPAMTAQLSGPGGIAIDHAGNIFIADSGNERVRRISPSGVIATVAGGGTAANVDGIPATTAQFIDLAAIAVDASGDIFVSDLGYSVVRKVSPSGIIATVAGNGTSGYSGDGGPAVHARLGDPGEAALAEFEGDVDRRGDEEDLERRIHGHQLVDEDADAAPDGAPVLERAHDQGRGGRRRRTNRRGAPVFDCGVHELTSRGSFAAAVHGRRWSGVDPRHTTTVVTCTGDLETHVTSGGDACGEREVGRPGPAHGRGVAPLYRYDSRVVPRDAPEAPRGP